MLADPQSAALVPMIAAITRTHANRRVGPWVVAAAFV